MRVTAKAETAEAADKVLADEVDLLAEMLGDIVFSVDDEPMEVGGAAPAARAASPWARPNR